MPLGTPVASAEKESASASSLESNALTTELGDGLVAFAKWEDAQGTITFSDQGGSSWTTLPAVANGGRCCMGYAPNAAAFSNNTVTVNFGATVTSISFAFCRVPGMATSSPLDTNSEATGSTFDAGSLVTSNADDILFLLGAAFGATTASNWFGGSGTELIDNGNPFAVGYYIVSATGTYDPTASFTGDTNRASVSAAFKAAAGGTPATPIPFVGRFGRPRTRYAY